MKKSTTWIGGKITEMGRYQCKIVKKTFCKYLNIIISINMSLINICSASERVVSGLGPPKMVFNTGRIGAGKPEFNLVLPEIHGPISPWKLLQWRKEKYLEPNDIKLNDTFTDPLLGRPVYRWTSEEADLNVYLRDGLYVYQMIGEDGSADSSGGSDIMISNDALSSPLIVGKIITIRFDARVSAALIEPRISNGPTDGNRLLGEAGMIIRSQYRDPESDTTYSVMLGVPVANSRNKAPEHFACHYFGQMRPPQIVSNFAVPGRSLLQFQIGDKFTTFNVDVGNVISYLTAVNFPCKDDTGISSDFKWPQSAFDLENWQVKSIALGVETHNRSDADEKFPSGHIKIGLDVRNIEVIYGGSP